MRDNRGVRRLFGYGVSAANHLTESDANMPLRETLTNSWDHIQGFLFPMLREENWPGLFEQIRGSVKWNPAGLTCSLV